MRILFAWELGDGFGHVLKQAPVMRALQARGHEVLMAAKDIVTAHAALGGIPFVQAPVPRGLGALPREIASHADILAVNGFGQPEILAAVAGAWTHLLQAWRPDLVASDHAPTAMLAAWLAGIPAVQLGTGFELPPAAQPFPCFRPWLALPADTLPAVESELLANVNTLCAAYGKPGIARLQDLFPAERQLLQTLPELDHYGVRAGARYAGPVYTLDHGKAVAWPDVPGKRILAYLHPSAALPHLLDILARLGNASVICAVPGIDPALARQFAARSLHIANAPVQLDTLLPECALVVNPGGHGLAAAALLHGIPQVLLPAHIEQLMLATRIAQQGFGIVLLPEQVEPRFADAVLHLLNTPDAGSAARAFAARHAGAASAAGVARAVAFLEDARR